LQKLSSDEERLSALKTEAASCLQASQGADCIIFNLFSLEGYFIAKHLGIPCIAASPHVVARFEHHNQLLAVLIKCCSI